MVGLKSKGKTVGILAMLSIIVIGMFSLCAHAATSNQYASLYGYKYIGADGNNYGVSNVTNNSGITRYINTSVRTSSDRVLVATGGKVGATASISTGGVKIYNYTGVYAHCWVYNSASPQSGVTGEALRCYIN